MRTLKELIEEVLLDEVNIRIYFTSGLCAYMDMLCIIYVISEKEFDSLSTYIDTELKYMYRIPTNSFKDLHAQYYFPYGDWQPRGEFLRHLLTIL